MRKFPRAARFLLYFFVDSFVISTVQNSNEDCVESGIERPRYHKACHNGFKGLKTRIKQLHPKHTEAEGEKDGADATKKGIAVCLQCVQKHVVDQADKGKLRDDKQADHAVIDGGLCRLTENQAKPNPSR